MPGKTNDNKSEPGNVSARREILVERSFFNGPGGVIGLSLIILLSACGGGGSTAAPSGLSYPSPAPFTVNKSISPLTPLVVGSVTSYTVSPALPAGLTIDGTTGVISGTPTTVTGSAIYTVAASNSSGSTHGGIPIAVNDIPPVVAYSQSPYSVTEGVAIATIPPTVTGGAVTAGWSINPVLPPGLIWNSATGSISGTPSGLSPATTYTVNTSNSGGQATTTFSLAVTALAPAVVFASPSFTFTANVTAQKISSTSSGGATTGWSITPALPAGLTFNTSNGSISGTPTAASAPAQYVVSASNSGGSVTQTLTIGVNSAPVLNLVHGVGVDLIRTTSSTVLSLDYQGHWSLQDYASGAELARGDGACGLNSYCPTTYSVTSAQPVYLPVDIAGTTMIDTTPAGVEVRSTTNGAVLATLPASYSWYQLASDGSYVCAGSKSALVAWNTAGQMLVNQSGDYSKANVRADPGQIRIALGAAGQNLIQTISTSTATASTSPTFQGQFSTWFLDGGSFLTTQGNVVFTYSSAAVQQDVTQVTTTSYLGGQGNWFWTYDAIAGLTIYKVGASTSPALSPGLGGGATTLIASNNTLGAVSTASQQLVTIDLSGATPSSSTVTLPSSYNSAYAAIPGGSWLVGNESGVVLDGATSGAPQPRYLALGGVSIVGGSTYFAVATASGEVFTYDTTTNTQVGTLPAGGLLAASSTGTVVVESNDTNTALNVYSLPSGNVTNSYAYTLAPNEVVTLSGNGAALVAPVTNTSGCALEALNLADNSLLWCGKGAIGNAPLSPDGTLVAAAAFVTTGGPTSTNIYKNGTLVTAIPAAAMTWLDNGRLLGYVSTLFIIPPNEQVYNYAGVAIYDPTGNVLSTSNIPLPETYDYVVASANSVYSRTRGSVYSLTSGAATWATGDPIPPGVGAGAVAGSEIVFNSGAYVLAQPYQ